MKKVRKDGKGMVLHKGESYIRKRKLYCYSYTDVLGKRRYIYAGNLVDLRAKEEQQMRNKLDKLDVYIEGKANVNFVYDRYMASKTELRSTTKTHYYYMYEKYVRNGFGKKLVIDIRYSDVFNYFMGLIERGVSISSVNEISKLLSSTFKLAIRDNIIRSNPTIGALHDLKKKTNLKERIRHALTLEEERAFLEYIEKPEYSRWKPLFTVMFGTGCRIGEIVGLRWCDINLEKGMISINHTINYGVRIDKNFRASYEVNPPKTEAGIRTIPMLDKVKEAFLLEKKNQKENGLESLVEVGGMSGFVFCNRYGGLLTLKGVNDVLHRIVDAYNYEEELKAKREGRDELRLPRFSCHAIRHTFCSRLCENETNVKVVQTVMGHKDIQTTLGIYAEVSEMKKKDVFKDLNRDMVF